MQCVFLADGDEAANRHSHAANEELFCAIEGTMTFLVGDQFVDAPAGTFLRVPAGVTHDFENRRAHRAGVPNASFPVASNRVCQRLSSGFGRALISDLSGHDSMRANAVSCESLGPSPQRRTMFASPIGEQHGRRTAPLSRLNTGFAGRSGRRLAEELETLAAGEGHVPPR
ncbi:MAG: cupin domain-containing protein [Vicinamibacterales bacterium]